MQVVNEKARILLLGACYVLSTLIVSPAMAGVTIPSPNSVEGDGQSSIYLPILSDTLQIRTVAKAELGTVKITQSDGIHGLIYTPPSVTKATQDTLTVKIRGTEKADLTVSVPLSPPWRPSLALTFDPPKVTPGETVTVKVSSKGAEVPISNDNRKLSIATSTGTVTPLVFNGTDTWLAQYTAPSTTTAPTQVVFAVVDAHAPTRSRVSGHLALVIEKNITLDATPDSSNVLTIGERQYGPKKASPTGKVAFKVNLHPERMEGQLESIAPDGTKSTTTQPLPVEARAGAVLHPMPLSLEQGKPYTVRVSCYQASSAPCAPNAPSLRLPNGNELPLGVTTGHEFAVNWTPEKTGDTTLEVSAYTQRMRQNLSVANGVPSFSLTSDVTQLEETAPFSVFAKFDQGQTKTIPFVYTQGVKQIRSLRRIGDQFEGSWRAEEGASNVTIIAAAPIEPSSSPATQLAVVPLTGTVTTSGQNVLLAVAAFDAIGRINPSVPVTLSLISGDGKLLPTISDPKSGVTLIPYKPGGTEGFVHLEATSGSLSTQTVLYQRDFAARNVSVPSMGTAAQEEHATLLKNRYQVLNLDSTATPQASTSSTSTVTSSRRSSSATSTVSAAIQSTTGSPQAVRTTRTRRTSAHDTAPFRIRYGLGLNPMQFSSKTRSGSIENFPPTSQYEVTPVALAFEAESWFGPDKVIGAEISSLISFYALDLGNPDQISLMVPVHFQVVGKYRFPIGASPWSAWVGLGTQRTMGTIIRYSDESRTSGTPIPKSIFGVQATGAIRGEWEDWLIEARLSSNFTPVPSFNPSARVEWRARGSITAGMSFSFDARYLLLKTEAPDAKVSNTILNETVLFYSGLVF